MAIIGDYIFYVQEKIECSLLTPKNYISTENMLNNVKGVYESSNTPTEGKCCKYVEGDILLSNIRPYFRKVWLADKVGGCSNDVLCFRSNENLILNKYVFYILSSQRFIDYVVSTSKGTKMPRGDKSAILKYDIKIPSLLIQQEIIDIIAPVEELFLKYSNLVRIDTVDNCENDVSNLIDIIRPLEEMEMLYKTIDDKISCIEKSILSSSSVTEQKFTFIKGGLPNKQEGPTMFLNVAAANGNPNRYVLNNPNVFIGDVTLSLDGNCGLVNNTLEGFNGYLYKVVLDNVDPWQIYYSLKTKYSQNIIKLNEIGTTIKHAPGAKKELRLHTFEHSEYLKYLYMLRIQLHKNRKTIIDSKKNLVKLLIK